MFVEENPQPTDQDMEWTQSFSKAIVIVRFDRISGTHVLFLGPMLYHAIPGSFWCHMVFSVFSVSYGWAF